MKQYERNGAVGWAVGIAAVGAVGFGAWLLFRPKNGLLTCTPTYTYQVRYADGTNGNSGDLNAKADGDALNQAHQLKTLPGELPTATVDVYRHCGSPFGVKRIGSV